MNEFVTILLYLIVAFSGVLLIVYLWYGTINTRIAWILLTLPFRMILSLFLDLPKIRTEFKVGYERIDADKYSSDLIREKDETSSGSFEVGERFEHFIEENLFPTKRFILMERTHSYATNNKRFVESSLNPDFKFRSKNTGREFWVEAKYRSKFYKGGIDWCSSEQLERYRDINKNTPVFIAVGVGGQPEKPHYVAVIPLAKIENNRLNLHDIESYVVNPGKLIEKR